MKRDELTLIGTCTSVHGVKGEVQSTVNNPIFDDMDIDYFVVEIDGTYIPFYIEEYRWKSDTAVLIKFADINSQKDAAQLINRNIYIDAIVEESCISMTDIDMLDGYEVEAVGHGTIGKVVNTDFITPENAVLLLDNGLIIPLHPDLVEGLDRHAHIITIRVPDGLI